MADDDPNRLKGSSCIATLDYAARTLTFVHRGLFRSPKPDGKVTKAVDGVLDFFSRFN